MKELRIVDVLWKSASIKETPGTNMGDASGLNKAGQQIVSMGTSESNTPDQVMMLTSKR